MNQTQPLCFSLPPSLPPTNSYKTQNGHKSPKKSAKNGRRNVKDMKNCEMKMNKVGSISNRFGRKDQFIEYSVDFAAIVCLFVREIWFGNLPLWTSLNKILWSPLSPLPSVFFFLCVLERMKMAIYRVLK